MKYDIIKQTGGIVMQTFVINVSVYLLSFIISFWALSGVKFENFCDVTKPGKAQMLLLLLSLGLGYIVAQFLLTITVYNGL